MTLLTEALDDLANDVGARMGWPASGARGLRSWLNLPDPPHPPAQYDLASADCDLPFREPVRSLVIATDYRSGSTVLAEGLTGAGGYGIPLEYFQDGAMERRFARFADPSRSRYVRNVMARRTSASGVFGVKVFWPEVEVISQLPDPVVVWLRREDVIAQAVSTWTALVSDVWRASRVSPQRNIPYDRGRLTALVGMHVHHASSWRDALAEAPVIDITYEHLSTDPTAVIESIAATLKKRGMPPEGRVSPPRLTRQANEHSRLIVARLTEDIARGRGV